MIKFDVGNIICKISSPVCFCHFETQCFVLLNCLSTSSQVTLERAPTFGEQFYKKIKTVNDT